MGKESEPPIYDSQDTVELDVEAIFRACDEAASREAAQAERPVDGQTHQPTRLREVFSSGRIYYRNDGGEEVVVRLDKWS